MEYREFVGQQVAQARTNMPSEEILYGEILFNNNDCQILSQSLQRTDFTVYSPQSDETLEVMLEIDETMLHIEPLINSKSASWNRYTYGCLLLLHEALGQPNSSVPEHKQYTREGMKKRVLKERMQKAENAEYRMEWAKNIYGDHTVINEKGRRYKVLLRDFDNETGYSNSIDAAVNGLGTTKHIMYAFKALKNDRKLYGSLSKTYPFIEVFLDPLNEYLITWHYPAPITPEVDALISKYFKGRSHIPAVELKAFASFLEVAKNYPQIMVRPEVQDKIERAFDDAVLQHLSQTTALDFSQIRADMYPYQKEGVKFGTFKRAAIIADEMGLGKTLQAIVTAIFKKNIFGFKHTLVVCPASLKAQWKKEIEKFTNEKAEVVDGTPEERAMRYRTSKSYFLIVNYETVLRDQTAINKADIDLLILDEAQRVKNYATQTASAIKNLERKHVLVITGTPIENKLIDLYSIVSLLDPYYLGAQWEFSYQHCLFDTEKHNKINGYFDLHKLKERLGGILIRRQKRAVLDQLPNVQQTNIMVGLTDLQMDYHASYAKGIAQIIRKKYLTQYDMQRMQLLLASMRMVCDSTFLIDAETNESPKLDELKYMLLDKLDIRNQPLKVIIFSEWVKVHKLIGRMLREHNIGFAELTGQIPVKHRGELIRKFETDPNCKVFLSTEAGGAGLNLQVADTLVNFELPWNPAKKNQRIGRIDRIGQKSNSLNIYNFISRNSIEERIAAGLLVKQDLFEGVLDQSSTTNFVDFSHKGRSQFIDQLNQMLEQMESPNNEDNDLLIIDEESNPNLTDNAVAEESTKLPTAAHTEEPMAEPRTESKIKQAEAQPEEIFELEEVPIVPQPAKQAKPSKPKTKEMETVLNSGLEFLSGILKMTTGADTGLEGKSIEVNEETGEVTMKFKLPGF